MKPTIGNIVKAPTGKILKRDLRDPYWQNHGRKL